MIPIGFGAPPAEPSLPEASASIESRPGVQVNGRFWTRDSGTPGGAGSSDAIEIVIQP